nr:MAG TPA: hypothetical protein [Caudoviricetes sp.]
MSLKTKTVTIEKGRDKGKKFQITEMPAAKIDNWAMRVLLALAGAGIDVAEANEGMMGLAKVAFAALGKIPPAVAVPLVRSWRICHSFAEILTLLKISAVPNKLQFRNENKSDDTVAFYFTNYIRSILHWFYQFYFFRPYKPIQVE